jgi:hypothetical protein
VTDLDLEAIKHRWAGVDVVPDDPCADVPILIAELERVLRLLGADPVPSVDAYENAVQALTDERAEVVRLCDLLVARDIELSALRSFTQWVVQVLPDVAERGQRLLGGVTS